MIIRGFVQRGWQVTTAFAVDGELITDYKRAGSNVVLVPHGQWLTGGSRKQAAIRWWRELKFREQFERLIRSCNPNIVYVNTMMGLAPAWAARRCRIPCVWHIRELFDDVGGEMRPPRPGGKPLAAFLIDHLASEIICLSHAVQENVLGGRGFGKTTVVPNAVDNRFFEARPNRIVCCRQFGLDPSKPVIGVPGTLRPVKGHRFFLNAAQLVIARFPTCQFSISGVGDQSHTEELHSYVKHLGLERNVRFIGNVRDMRTFFGACDIACIPSRSESFGRTAIESFACNVPVIASAVGGLREIISHGETGLLVEYGRPMDLADAILKLLMNRDLAIRLAVNARRVADREYREKIYQQRIYSLINRVLTK